MPYKKIENLETVQTSYSYYKSNVEEPLPRKAYIALIYLFMKFITSRILAGHYIILPWLGTISLRGKKDEPRIDSDGRIKGLSIDYNATRIARKENPQAPVIYHFNEHSRGISYIIFWCKKKMYGENKELYSFTPVRATKREMARLIKEGKIEYEIDLRANP